MQSSFHFDSSKNKPCVNQKMTKRAYMKELLVEIASLKRDNEVLRSKNGIIVMLFEEPANAVIDAIHGQLWRRSLDLA